MRMDYKQKNKGFTLVETLVAISILSISIAATFTAVQNGIRSSDLAKEQTTAFYLAQEGMEAIKNIRDQNALNSVSGVTTNWLRGLSEVAGDICYFGKTCSIDAPLASVRTCPGGFDTCEVLLLDPTSNLYGYTSGWTATTFRRELQFQNIVAGQEIRVLMKISWVSRGATQSFQISESFFNRQ